jgi:hypothetical protein
MHHCPCPSPLSRWNFPTLLAMLARFQAEPLPSSRKTALCSRSNAEGESRVQN